MKKPCIYHQRSNRHLRDKQIQCLTSWQQSTTYIKRMSFLKNRIYQNWHNEGTANLVSSVSFKESESIFKNTFTFSGNRGGITAKLIRLALTLILKPDKDTTKNENYRILQKITEYYKK